MRLYYPFKRLHGIEESCVSAILTGRNALELFEATGQVTLVRVAEVLGNLPNCHVIFQQQSRLPDASGFGVDMHWKSDVANKDVRQVIRAHVHQTA
jgi:hypothetical protein